MIEKGIVIHEAEPRSSFRVNRLRVTGANQFGRPQAEEAGEQEFSNLLDAFRWSSKAPEYSHHFSTDIPKLDLRAQLTGPRISGPEMLAVNSNGKTGVSPRAVENHHAVSTDYTTFFNLIIYLDASQGPIFDRGVVWVEIPQLTESPVLSFTINAGIHTAEELEKETLKMYVRVGQVLNDLVEKE